MRARQALERHAFDVLIVMLAALALAEASFDPSQRPRGVTVPFAFLWTLPLLFRRRFPLGTPVAVLVVLGVEAFLADEAVTSSQANGVAIITAFGVLGFHPDLRSALLGAAIGYLSMVAIVLDDRPRAAGTAAIFAVTAVAWAVGRALGERGRRAAALERRADRLEREQTAAVAEERGRIARELHDVIAHSVSVMTVQAGAARLLLDEDPARARQSLVAVEETGRQALGEMRRLLGILRGDEHETQLAPQPGIADMDALVEQVRAAGLPVDLVVEGEPKGLAPGVDLAVYRVVQEALTNALKHAGAARAHVAIRYEERALELVVVNDGHVSHNGRVGHGLIGMRERVALYGGEFQAGPRSEGGYAVRARLPVDEAEP